MQYVIDNINPPGLEKKNRGAVYRIIGRIGQQVKADAIRVLHNFFPFLAEETILEKHARAFSIPRFSFDTEEDFRQRVATAGKYLERQGERALVLEFLNQLVPERYKLIEYPQMGFQIGYSKLGYSPLGGGCMLFIKVTNLTTREYENIYAILDNILDPDIPINVVEWIKAGG